MRTRTIYDVLAHAIVDVNFRESLFRDGSRVVSDVSLTREEAAYLNNLPSASFEGMVGRMVSHWLIPIPVNNRYMILPESAGDLPSNGYIPIRLAESFVFGNGAHPTTALCLAAVDDYLLPGSDVLDLGTGSGILSIAAVSRGASAVLALDIDPDSVATAKENMALNSVDETVTVELGSLNEAMKTSRDRGGFDLVLANILTPVLVAFLQTGLARTLKPGASLVASGIETSEVPLVERATLDAGLTKVALIEDQGWAAVVARKPSPQDQNG